MMQLQSLISILVLVLLSIAVGTHQQPVKGPANKNPSNSNPKFAGGNFEGDITGPLPFSRSNTKSGTVIPVKINKWEDNTIPYVISRRFSQEEKDKIEAAMNEYHHKTCLRFVPKTSDHKNFVRIYKGEDCSSHVGRKAGAGRQELSLGEGCVHHGTIVHELMHAIGFYHEQSRMDRDDYVKIIEGNIKKENLHNFRKYTNTRINKVFTSYDYESIMHYDRNAFAKYPKIPTIVTLKPMHGKLGQDFALSDKDKRKINIYYECPKTRNNKT